MIPYLRAIALPYLHLLSTTGPIYAAGTGSPEGVLTAPVGSVWSRTDGGTNATLYRKESGTGNTGWVAVSNAGGGATATAITLDFGSTPIQSKTFSFAHAGATTGQKIIVSVSGDMPSGVDFDELEMEPVVVVGRVSATDTIELQATVAGFITGKRNFNYMVL